MPKLLKIDALIEAIINFLKVKFEIVKVDIIEKLSALVANVVVFMIAFSIFMFFLIFFSFFMATMLNEQLESMFWGYGIVASFYLLIVIIMLILLKSGKIQGLIERAIISATESEEDEEI